MSETTTSDDQRRALLELYDSALPDVYGYLASRCGSAAVAEDLTPETFLARGPSARNATSRPGPTTSTSGTPASIRSAPPRPSTSRGGHP